MSNITAQLKAHAFFKDLSDIHLERLATPSEVTRFSANATIAEEGTASQHFFLILNGKIALETRHTTAGQVTITTVRGGDLLGWSWLFPPHRWYFDVRALTDVDVIRFEANPVREAMEADRDFGYELMRRFALLIKDRLQVTRLQFLDIYAG